MDVTSLASDLAVDRIQAALAEAVAKGAKILVGGKVEGNLVYPTVIQNATDDMLGMREEVFGPVLFTSSFSDGEEVVARAKNHRYGLRASVYGGDEATLTAAALKGEQYCHPVPDYTFGKFGTAVAFLIQGCQDDHYFPLNIFSIIRPVTLPPGPALQASNNALRPCE